MIAILLVLDAQLADLLTFGMAAQRLGISGESNPLVHLLYPVAGIGGIVALKVCGALLAALIVSRAPRWTIFAAGMGLLGAAVNLAA